MTEDQIKSLADVLSWNVEKSMFCNPTDDCPRRKNCAERFITCIKEFLTDSHQTNEV